MRATIRGGRQTHQHHLLALFRNLKPVYSVSRLRIKVKFFYPAKLTYCVEEKWIVTRCEETEHSFDAVRVVTDMSKAIHFVHVYLLSYNPTLYKTPPQRELYNSFWELKWFLVSFKCSDRRSQRPREQSALNNMIWFSFNYFLLGNIQQSYKAIYKRWYWTIWISLWSLSNI